MDTDTIYPICCGLCGQELQIDEKTTISNIGREHFDICLLVKERKGNE
jgi:transcription elongation factor Elf1